MGGGGSLSVLTFVTLRLPLCETLVVFLVGGICSDSLRFTPCSAENMVAAVQLSGTLA